MMSKGRIRLFKNKVCIRPTIWGWIIILIILYSLFRISLTGIVRYLSMDAPVGSKTMVLEGYVPTYAIKDAMNYFRDNGYKRLIITGIPIVNYEFIAPYKSTAEATVLAVRHFGYKDTVYIADIPTNILVDRTYSTAVETRLIFDENPEWPKNMDIYSVGVHSRRTYNMFRKVFGRDYNIGIIAHRDRTFDPDHWWKSSKGFRNVSNEFLATFYTMAFFHPDLNKNIENIRHGNYLDSIYYLRQDKNILFADSTRSPFNEKEIEHFSSFRYFEPDTSFRITAEFIIDTSAPSFKMPTTTNRTPEYRIYGYLKFYINDTLCNLTVYQNIEYINHIEYGEFLFVPFTDRTNFSSTYEAGRYIDIEIPGMNSVVIDFNNAYNPYCAYSDRWSCPLVPYENHLEVDIKAGEKRYKNY